MKVLFAVVALVAVAIAEAAYPVAVSSYHQAPAHLSASSANAYGAHGQHSAGYGAHGQSAYGNSGRYGDKASAAQAHHNVGGYGSHDAYGAQGSNYGKYRNVGAYAQDKGTGYEKSYAYDKKAGSQKVLSDYGATQGSYGVKDLKANHNVGGYGSAGHARYGAQDKYGAQAYGVNSHDNSAYGKYGNAHAQQVHVAPAVHSTYSAAPVAHYAPAPAVHYAAAPVAHYAAAPAAHYAAAPAAHYAAAPVAHYAAAPVSHYAAAPVAHKYY